MKSHHLSISLLACCLSALPMVASANGTTYKGSTHQSVNGRVAELEKQVEELERNMPHFGKHEPFFLHSMPVLTSPYVGTRSRFDSQELITNISSINEDLRLLEQKQRLENELRRGGRPLPDHPVVEISGKIQAFASYRDPYVGAQQSDIDLDSAELDTAINVDRYAVGFFSMKYDKAAPALAAGGQRTSNSRVFVDKGFFTFGNLDECDFYLTAGQLVLPFGQYSTHLLSTLGVDDLGETKARAVVLGYTNAQHGEGFNAQAYFFRGDIRTQDHGTINAGGLNANWNGTFNKGHNSVDVGVGVISDIANSNGFQNNGNDPAFGLFQGFGATAASEKLMDHVPAVNVHGKLGLGQQFGFVAELVYPTEDFMPADLAFNGSGARPYAFDLEGTMNFPFFGKPAAFSIHYGHTSEALGLNLPESSISAIFNTVIWKNTIESIEYRHDNDYDTADVATGNNGAAITGTGGSRDTVVVEAGIYF